MFAFEFYQNANEVIRGEPDAPKRDLLRRLLKSKRLRRAISSRKEVEFLARSKEIDYARLAAESPPPNWILDR
jgi:hypothetical protein